MQPVIIINRRSFNHVFFHIDYLPSEFVLSAIEMYTFMTIVFRTIKNINVYHKIMHKSFVGFSVHQSRLAIKCLAAYDGVPGLCEQNGYLQQFRYFKHELLPCCVGAHQ